MHMAKWLTGAALLVAFAFLWVDAGQANSKDGPRRWKRTIPLISMKMGHGGKADHPP